MAMQSYSSEFPDPPALLGGAQGMKKQKFKNKTVGGSPTASYFFLLRQEKVTKKKATPVRRRCAVPCVARLVRRLRNSRYALKQSSPKSPDQPALLGGAQGKWVGSKDSM